MKRCLCAAIFVVISLVPSFAEGVWSNVIIQVPYIELFQEWGPLLSVPVSVEAGTGLFSARGELGWVFCSSGSNSGVLYGSLGARIYSKNQGIGFYLELCPVYRSIIYELNDTSTIHLNAAAIIGYSGTIASSLGWEIFMPCTLVDVDKSDRYLLPNIGIDIKYSIAGENE